MTSESNGSNAFVFSRLTLLCKFERSPPDSVLPVVDCPRASARMQGTTGALSKPVSHGNHAVPDAAFAVSFSWVRQISLTSSCVT